MASAVIEQLTTGVRVRCADGEEIVCKPLPLLVGMEMIDLWDKRNAPLDRMRAIRDRLAVPLDPEEREKLTLELGALARESYTARLAVVRKFYAAYPELRQRISAGDVEMLVPDFFWSATGAYVPGTNGDAPIGTPPGVSTPPSTELSPTP